jgi:O-antigen/teichoic acid export membrane protein
MVPAMQLLVFWGLMRSVGAPIGSLLQASGRPRVHTRLQLTKFLLLAICIYPMTKAWGMTGTALAVVVHTLPIEVYVHYLAVRLLRSPVVPYLQSLLFPLLASSIMFLAVWTLKMLIFQSVGVIGLVVLVVIGSLTYAAVVGLLEFCFQYGLRDIVSRVLAKPFQQG